MDDFIQEPEFKELAHDPALAYAIREITTHAIHSRMHPPCADAHGISVEIVDPVEVRAVSEWMEGINLASAQMIAITRRSLDDDHDHDHTHEHLANDAFQAALGYVAGHAMHLADHPDHEGLVASNPLPEEDMLELAAWAERIAKAAEDVAAVIREELTGHDNEL